MTTSLSSTTPSKLYAFQLKLRPLERGTIMPFTGEMVHAAWLEWIRAEAPDVSAFLHEGNKHMGGIGSLSASLLEQPQFAHPV